MAAPSVEELRGAIALLAERLGYGKLHDRLVRLNAFVSRRKPASPDVLADRIYSLSGGLRRQVPATIAFHTVWSETFSGAVGEDDEKTLEGIADRINATLTEDERGIRDGRDGELAAALHDYERVLGGVIGARAARLDMVLKAVPAVAERLRQRPLGEVAAPTAASGVGAPAGD
jgi:hypothetical protein